MSRVYYKYHLWEDYQNGMYNPCDGNEQELVQDAILILTDEKLFLSESLKMINEWVISAEENLSNKDQNRRAWIGQACCCYTFGVPEIVTKKAWGLITDLQRYKANKVADKVISEYESKNRKLHTDVGAEMLF
jgi:hypothetical protein